MKFFAILALATGAYASCYSFSLIASGGEAGTVGHLDDGQIRIGGGLPQTCYNICSNGTVTDSNGYGCYITPEADQFQCDLNKSPAAGFSITTNGTFEYSGKSTFYACPASDTEWNIYTSPVAGQAKCVKIGLSASTSGCSATSTCSASVSTITSSYVSTITEVSTITQAAATVSEAGKTVTISQPGSTVVETSTVTEAGNPVTVSEAGSTITITQAGSVSTITEAGNTVIITQAGSATTEYSTVTQAAKTVTVSECEVSTITVAQSQSGSTIYETSSVKTMVTASIPVATTSVIVETTYPATSASSISTTYTQVSQTTASSSVYSTTAIPSSGYSSKYTLTSTSIPLTTAVTTLYTSKSSSYIWHNTTTTATPTTSSSSASSCVSTALTGTYTAGNYQYPHLIVPISSTHPDTAYGTQYFGTISSNVSTIFNFDIPTSYSGKTCNLIFLLPLQSELETSSYEFSGAGEVDFSQLSTVATEATTYDTAGSVETDFGDFILTEGSSTLIKSFECAAGTTVSYEAKAVGDTYLYFFQDYNPSPLGLYVTVCE